MLFSIFPIFVPTLRIDIAHTLTESEERRIVWSHAESAELFDELHLVGDLVAQVLICPEGDSKCLVTGTISGVQTLTCSRTLEEFESPFTTEMVVEVERLPIGQQELDDDDDEAFAYKIPQGQDFVDVSECVRQLVILQEPQHPVKNPDEEFIFVTNKPPEEESAIDPRWEKLKALKQKLESK